MKILIGLLLALLMIQTTGCGLFQNDDDDVSSNNGPENSELFALTGNEVTDITGDQVAAFVNKSSGLMDQPKLEGVVSLLLNSASKISRDDGNANFSKCIAQKMNDTKLQVTHDTVSFNFDFDFIAICDRKELPTDLIGEIKNTMKATVTFGCAGGTISSLQGKFVENLNGEDVLGKLCKDATTNKILSKKVTYEYTVDARKTTTVKKGTEYEVVLVNSVFTNASLKAKNNSPCNLLVVNDTTSRVDSCRAISQSKTFKAHPKYEANSANDKAAPHPIVNQTVITVNDGIWEHDAQFYTTADTTFLANGWNGVLTYRNGWAAPTWEATLGITSAKRGGTWGSTTTTVISGN